MARQWVFKFHSNVPEVQARVAKATERALEKMGAQAETYAKKLCPADTGRLKNSITHRKADDETELVGTNVEYAPYVELGHHQEAGRYVPAIGKRLVKDFVSGKPFLKPAIENHASEYREIAEAEFKKV